MQVILLFGGIYLALKRQNVTGRIKVHDMVPMFLQNSCTIVTRSRVGQLLHFFLSCRVTCTRLEAFFSGKDNSDWGITVL